MNRIHAVKCYARQAHAIIVCHMTTETVRHAVPHVRACHAKRGGHLPDTTPHGFGERKKART